LKENSSAREEANLATWREEKTQLREEKTQLREEKILLLKQQERQADVGDRSSSSTWRRPSIAKTVSGASAKDQTEVVSGLYSIIDVPATFKCVQAFDHPTGVHVAASTSIVSEVQRSPHYLPEQLTSGERKLEGEEAMHSRFFSAFHRWWTSLDQNAYPVLWFHEHRLYTLSKIDVIGYFNVQQPEQHLQPAVLIEFVLESTTTFEKKLAQLQAQARNACHVCHSQSLPCFLGVLIDPSSFKFEVHAFVGAEAASLADVMLVRGGRAGLPALLSLLQVWSSHLHSLKLTDALCKPAGHCNQRVRIHQGLRRVLKEYDYRSDVTGRPEVSEHDRRRPPSQELLDAGMLPNATLEISTPSLSVLAYDYIPGSHVACNSAQFVEAGLQLRSLHRMGYVHGDVRESNIVFSDGGNDARLIDFDFCRKQEDRPVYVSNFNTDIDDGKRHPHADSGSPLQFTHDWFALHAVMLLYSPADDDDDDDDEVADQWQSLLTAVHGGHVAEGHSGMSFSLKRSEPCT
jgi:hypothetical protein